MRTHQHCDAGTSCLPSRVLDLDASLDSVKLVETNGVEGRYATLSHCCKFRRHSYIS
jgi:hypothetical protein